MCTNNDSHEMITSSKEASSSSKQEVNTSEAKIITKASSSSPSPWLRLKDPRIVRVSRAFGGKDRHSKVCTIRGLRDRRVRLSVPTAIQLYDLQDRLGLNQPSKVVDWLLNAAKDEIDELPPLPALPTGNFGLNHQEILSSNEVGSSQNKEGFRIEGSSINWEGGEGLPRSNAWSSEALWRAKSKETARETIDDKEINWTKRTDHEEKLDRVNEGGHGAEASSVNFLPRPSTNSSLPNLLNNALPFGSYYHLEPSNFPFSQLGSHGFTPQTEELHNFNVVPLPSALSLSSGPQILVCPPPGATQPFFPSHAEIDPRQINHFQMLSPNPHNLSANSLCQTPQSISQPMRPFHFGMTSRFLPASGTNSQSDKDQAFPSK